MADFPRYVHILTDGFSDSFDPSVERTEMERGVPKQRLANSQVLVKLGATLFFRSAADVAAFETWYFDTIKRIGWFQIKHPRTGATIAARFENGSIGTLVPLGPAFFIASRNVVMEYLR
ncbi:hypothetical protein [Stenotrophomonas sp. NLF4-10]|uniref:hypothetical protein n=1 Tax=Stenotrophomonas sp. NLF4-10 TaxID=2918754 RepID=UPI001EFB5EC8|nr:hypothetical protein [Stenotrophomonas sp. NLF4-10]MCG8275410.1 hypothetical protein [Stenotrophomonas sp. NLF4-10]